MPERAARNILKAKQFELSAGGQLLRTHPPAVQSFGRFAHDYLLWHRSEYPDSHYRIAQIIEDHLLPRFELRPLDMISEAEVEQYKQDRRIKVKSQTIVKELRTLKAMLNRAVSTRLIAANPVQLVRPPKKLDSKPHRFYEADELTGLYAACAVKVNNGEGQQPDPMHAWIWKLYANTGMRRMEGLYLKRKWIGREGIKIVSAEEARTKSGKWREIPMSRGAEEALDALPKADYVLPRMQPGSLSRAFLRDAMRARLDGSMHTLRHTYISHLVRAGVPLRTVQLYAGHAHYSTTEQYAYLVPGTSPVAVSAMRL